MEDGPKLMKQDHSGGFLFESPVLARAPLAMLLAGLLFAIGARAQTPDGPAAKPNFIVILADDMGYGDVGPFGSTKNRTPNLDRMAKEGLKMTSFYGAPVCTPSRAQLITGCYAKRVSLPDVLFPAEAIGLSSKEHTLAELLKAQGYATMAIGKWHLGDHPDFLPTRHGFDRYFGLPYSNDMGGPTNAAKAASRASATKIRPPLPLVRDANVLETVTDEGQNRLTERYTEEAIQFIRENKGRPFFLYMPHTAVHVPLHPGDKFRGASANGRYGDWVEEVDWSVGRVMDTVRELGLSGRTLVFFTSDNGPWLTQGTNGGVATPLRGGKAGTFEGGVREPTIAWWPGKVPVGASVDAMAANYDLLPTLVKLAGGEVPKDNKIDGRDISPILLGQTRESPHLAHYYFDGNRLQAVRSGPWKLAVARQAEHTGKPEPDADKPFTQTLYNLDSDIGERTNVAAQNPEVVQKLLKLVADMNADLGTNKAGPGVRPPGRVTNSVGLWMAGQAPSADLIAAHYDVPSLDQLAIGDALGRGEAPKIANKSLTITAEVESKSSNGVIVAQGGSATGYAVYLREGKPVFTVRERSQPVSITATNAAPPHFKVEARLASDGAMTLMIDGQTVASGKAPSLIRTQPAEDFCVGFDNGQPVGEYSGNAQFNGVISHLNILAK